MSIYLSSPAKPQRTGLTQGYPRACSCSCLRARTCGFAGGVQLLNACPATEGQPACEAAAHGVITT
eukprot:scaffold104661_cov60-Phaeocystis_antarctica.AAC.2